MGPDLLPRAQDPAVVRGTVPNQLRSHASRLSSSTDPLADASGKTARRSTIRDGGLRGEDLEQARPCCRSTGRRSRATRLPLRRCRRRGSRGSRARGSGGDAGVEELAGGSAGLAAASLGRHRWAPVWAGERRADGGPGRSGVARRARRVHPGAAAPCSRRCDGLRQPVEEVAPGTPRRGRGASSTPSASPLTRSARGIDGGSPSGVRTAGDGAAAEDGLAEALADIAGSRRPWTVCSRAAAWKASRHGRVGGAEVEEIAQPRGEPVQPLRRRG